MGRRKRSEKKKKLQQTTTNDKQHEQHKKSSQRVFISFLGSPNSLHFRFGDSIFLSSAQPVVVDINKWQSSIFMSVRAHETVSETTENSLMSRPAFSNFSVDIFFASFFIPRQRHLRITPKHHQMEVIYENKYLLFAQSIMLAIYFNFFFLLPPHRWLSQRPKPAEVAVNREEKKATEIPLRTSQLSYRIGLLNLYRNRIWDDSSNWTNTRDGIFFVMNSHIQLKNIGSAQFAGTEHGVCLLKNGEKMAQKSIWCGARSDRDGLCVFLRSSQISSTRRTCECEHFYAIRKFEQHAAWCGVKVSKRRRIEWKTHSGWWKFVFHWKMLATASLPSRNQFIFINIRK